MKRLIIKICAWLIKQGADKWLHVLIALVMAALIMLIPVNMYGRILLAVWVPFFADIFKELKIDGAVDGLDVLYTIIGAGLGTLIAWLNIICATA